MHGRLSRAAACLIMPLSKQSVRGSARASKAGALGCVRAGCSIRKPFDFPKEAMI